MSSDVIEYNVLMAKQSKHESEPDHSIAINKRARHDYFIEDRIEAGLAMHGWEVKSLREKRVHLQESYVVIKDDEAWLIGAHITPLPTVSTHNIVDPLRTRKLLLHKSEISRLAGAVERRGYTLIPLRLYWKHGRAKIELGLAKGKKQYDKREASKVRDWQRQKQRIIKDSNR